MFTRHQRSRRAIDRLLTRGLSPQRHAKLRDHLRECDDCRAYYERSRRLEDALFAGRDLNPAAAERLGALVVASEARATRRPLALGVLAAATALILAVITWPPPQDDFVARGALAAAGELSVFRVDAQTRAIERLPEGASVHAGEVIQLAYMSRGFDHAVVVGVDARGEVQWYHPAEPNSGGVPLRPDGVEEPFGGAWTITAPPGPLRFHALFARGAVPMGELEDALSTLAVGAAPSPLPGVSAHQYTLQVEVAR